MNDEERRSSVTEIQAATGPLDSLGRGRDRRERGARGLAGCLEAGLDGSTAFDSEAALFLGRGVETCLGLRTGFADFAAARAGFFTADFFAARGVDDFLPRLGAEALFFAAIRVLGGAGLFLADADRPAPEADGFFFEAFFASPFFFPLTGGIRRSFPCSKVLFRMRMAHYTNRTPNSPVLFGRKKPPLENRDSGTRQGNQNLSVIH